MSEPMFGPKDDTIHEPGPDDIWQESYWVYFGNGKGTGGGIHIGQQVNIGKSNIFALCYDGETAFRRAIDDYELDRDIRASGRFNAGPYVATPTSDGVHIGAKDDELELDLTFTLQSQDLRWLSPFPMLTHVGTKTSSINYQSPGRVRGNMRLGKKTIDVDAFAQRGHSWGNRDYKALRGNGSRWITGSIGDRLSFQSYAAIRADGMVICSAFVVDRGELSYTSDIDVMVEVGLDGVTYRGGVVRLKFPDREYVFRCKLDNINLVQHHGSEISVGGGDLRVDGMIEVGYSAWEINDRPHTPRGGVPFSLGSWVEDGLHRRK